MSALANQPAFPQCMVPDGQPTPIAQRIVESKGLTLRQYYAGLAMQGILSNAALATMFSEMPGFEFREIASDRAVKYADALIAKLEETK